jgi:hypothetical protein
VRNKNWWGKGMTAETLGRVKATKKPAGPVSAVERAFHQEHPGGVFLRLPVILPA